MLTSARITLTHHRFEIGAAALAALVVGISALVVNYRLQSIGVPAGCFDAWLNGGGADGAGSCAAPVQAFATINEEEAGKIFAAMAVLPFAVGLLGGVPLVGRELETRTAQTAWSLSGSRLRWLGRQLVPVFVVLVAAVSIAAAGADLLERTRSPWYHSAYSDMALHGPIVVGRSIAALGIGLLVGAVIGRTLPALIIGALASLLALTLVSVAQGAWYRTLPTVAYDSTASPTADEMVAMTGWGWRTPAGAAITDAEGQSLVPNDISNLDDGLPQPVNGDQWLTDRGYVQVEFGVTATQALRWIPYDVAIFSGLGAAGAVAAAFVVTRRRPA